MCQTHSQKTLLSERLMVLSAVFGGTGVGEEGEFLHGQVSRCWQDYTLHKCLWELLTPKAVPAHDCGTRRNRVWVPAVFLLPSLLKYPQSCPSSWLWHKKKQGLGPCCISSSFFTKVPPIIFFHIALQAESDKRKNTTCHKTDFGQGLRKKILKLSVFCIYKKVKFDSS